MEHKHHVSYQMHRFGIPPEYARWFESLLVTGFFHAVRGVLQNIVQVTIATMLWKEYIPFWDARTAACEEPIDRGGVPYSEYASSLAATAIFYFLVPFVIHVLLNTFVWGFAPRGSGSLISSNRSTFFVRQLPKSYRAKPKDAHNYFIMFGRTISGVDVANYGSPLKWLSICPDNMSRTEDLILHDPRFWQVPRLWWQHFKNENGNSSSRAFSAYIHVMLWKLKLLVKLTFGVWEESQIEQFQIRYRSMEMSLSAEVLEEHEAMIKAVGQQQSTVWLFIPVVGAFFSKLGDAFNQIPLFIYDRTSERAIVIAEDTYTTYLLRNKQDVDKAEVEAWHVEKEGRDAAQKPKEAKPVVRFEAPRTYRKYGALPMEWMRVPSRLRPGGIAYENYRTGEISDIHPRDPIYLKHKKDLEKKEKEKRKAMAIQKRQKDKESKRPPELVPSPTEGNDTVSLNSSLSATPNQNVAPASSDQSTESRADLKVPETRSPRLPASASSGSGNRTVLSRDSDTHSAPSPSIQLVSRPTQALLDALSASSASPTPSPGPVETSIAPVEGEGHGRDKVMNSRDRHEIEASYPIEEWLEDLRYGNADRFTSAFTRCKITNVRELRALNDHEFMIVKRKLQKRREKASKKLTELLNALDEMRRSPEIVVARPFVDQVEKEVEVEQDTRENINEVGDDEDSENENALERTAGEGDKDGDRGIEVLIFDEREQHRSGLTLSQETRRYWIIEVQRPEGERAHRGEGMLLWFTKDSEVGLAGSVVEEEDAFVRFLEYRKNKDEIDNNQHGQTIPSLRAHFMYEYNHLSKPMQFGSKYSGRSGMNLPNRDDPVFIPGSLRENGKASAITCALCLDIPPGTEPRFTLHACYVGDTPLFGLKPDFYRKLSWALHISLILSTTLIVIGYGFSQRVGIYLFLVASMVIALMDAEELYVS